MEIDLGKELVIKVKVGTDTHLLREPTLDDIEKMADVDQADMKASNRALQGFVMDLGLPEDVVKSLGVLRLKRLVEGLTSSFSEGK